MNLTTEESFEVAYISYNPEKNEYNSEIKIAQEPSNEIKTFIGNNLKALNSLNTKEFDYVLFEEDINLLSESEFKYYWVKFFDNWLEMIQRNYFDISYDDFKFQMSNSLERKVLLKKIIHFIMMFFPYAIVKDLVKYKDELCDNIEMIRATINERFNQYLKNIDNLIESLSILLKNSKKNEETPELIEEQLNKQKEYLVIFKEIIDRTDCERLQELFNSYYRYDKENLLAE